MGRKKNKVRINIFRRIKNSLIVFGGALKKRYFTDKISAFTITKMNESYMKSLITATNKKEALNMIFKSATELGHEYMVELSAFLESNIHVPPAYAKAAWLMFSGHKPSSVTYEIEKIKHHTCYKLLFTDKNCAWCKDIEFDTNFCVYPAGAYNGAGQTWAELTGAPYNIICRETKCKATGAEACEFVFFIAPKECPIEDIKEAHPEWFEIIEHEFFEF
ncbi:MAG: hypothetical protein ACTSQE_11960 [Candidatus Heimdallarchaeaceae archaeon]